MLDRLPSVTWHQLRSTVTSHQTGSSTSSNWNMWPRSSSRTWTRSLMSIIIRCLRLERQLRSGEMSVGSSMQMIIIIRNMLNVIDSSYLIDW